MNITVVGDDTLAEAAATCCEKYYPVTREPGDKTDVLWVCYDTPILKGFKPDVTSVLERIYDDLHKVKRRALILISSQLPVGTTRKLSGRYPEFQFAHSPENLRAKTAVADFAIQSRIVVGVSEGDDRTVLEELLLHFTDTVVFVSPETAEMVKHALNGFLAMSIAYANEIAAICDEVGANRFEVAKSMKLDPRIGMKAPITPGDPYGGGHLEREIWNLTHLAKAHSLTLPIIAHIQESNQRKR